jgi:putative lipoprotein
MRKLLYGVSLLIILAMSSAALAHDDDAAFGTVSGTISYRQRIALPPDAEVVVELSDVSRMDVPATVIASQRIIANGRQVPIPFSLTYDTVSITENGTYTVSAKIFVGGQLRWISDTVYPVGNNGEFTADINVVQVSAPAEATEPAVSAPFGTVTGTVTYLQRIALPDDAVLTVELQDTSRADAPAFVLAQQQFATNGRQVPFAFALNYDTGSIAVNGRYTVRATIRLGDELIWTSDTANLVITNDVFDVEVMLVQVG